MSTLVIHQRGISHYPSMRRPPKIEIPDSDSLNLSGIAQEALRVNEETPASSHAFQRTKTLTLSYPTTAIPLDSKTETPTETDFFDAISKKMISCHGTRSHIDPSIRLSETGTKVSLLSQEVKNCKTLFSILEEKEKPDVIGFLSDLLDLAKLTSSDLENLDIKSINELIKNLPSMDISDTETLKAIDERVYKLLRLLNNEIKRNEFLNTLSQSLKDIQVDQQVSGQLSELSSEESDNEIIKLIGLRYTLITRQNIDSDEINLQVSTLKDLAGYTFAALETDTVFRYFFAKIKEGDKASNINLSDRDIIFLKNYNASITKTKRISDTILRTKSSPNIDLKAHTERLLKKLRSQIECESIQEIAEYQWNQHLQIIRDSAAFFISLNNTLVSIQSSLEIEPTILNLTENPGGTIIQLGRGSEPIKGHRFHTEMAHSCSRAIYQDNFYPILLNILSSIKEDEALPEKLEKLLKNLKLNEDEINLLRTKSFRDEITTNLDYFDFFIVRANIRRFFKLDIPYDASNTLLSSLGENLFKIDTPDESMKEALKLLGLEEETITNQGGLDDIGALVRSFNSIGNALDRNLGEKDENGKRIAQSIISSSSYAYYRAGFGVDTLGAINTHDQLIEKGDDIEHRINLINYAFEADPETKPLYNMMESYINYIKDIYNKKQDDLDKRITPIAPLKTSYQELQAHASSIKETNPIEYFRSLNLFIENSTLFLTGSTIEPKTEILKEKLLSLSRKIPQAAVDSTVKYFKNRRKDSDQYTNPISIIIKSLEDEQKPTPSEISDIIGKAIGKLNVIQESITEFTKTFSEFKDSDIYISPIEVENVINMLNELRKKDTITDEDIDNLNQYSEFIDKLTNPDLLLYTSNGAPFYKELTGLLFLVFLELNFKDANAEATSDTNLNTAIETFTDHFNENLKKLFLKLILKCQTPEKIQTNIEKMNIAIDSIQRLIKPQMDALGIPYESIDAVDKLKAILDSKAKEYLKTIKLVESRIKFLSKKEFENDSTAIAKLNELKARMKSLKIEQKANRQKSNPVYALTEIIKQREELEFELELIKKYQENSTIPPFCIIAPINIEELDQIEDKIKQGDLIEQLMSTEHVNFLNAFNLEEFIAEINVSDPEYNMELISRELNRNIICVLPRL